MATNSLQAHAPAPLRPRDAPQYLVVAAAILFWFTVGEDRHVDVVLTQKQPEMQAGGTRTNNTDTIFH